MNIKSFIKKLYLNTSGGPVKRTIITIVVGSLFALITSLFVIIPIRLERFLNLPVLLKPPLNIILGMPLINIGIFFMLWTSILFFIKKGTPVPNTAPSKLITTGPYSFSRNPMHGGMFLMMFGVGFYYSSLLALLFFIPLYVFLDTRIHKYIEEPELEKRFGEEYLKYKNRVPGFIGWKRKLP